MPKFFKRSKMLAQGDYGDVEFLCCVDIMQFLAKDEAIRCRRESIVRRTPDSKPSDCQVMTSLYLSCDRLQRRKGTGAVVRTEFAAEVPPLRPASFVRLSRPENEMGCRIGQHNFNPKRRNIMRLHRNQLCPVNRSRSYYGREASPKGRA